MQGQSILTPKWPDYRNFLKFIFCSSEHKRSPTEAIHVYRPNLWDLQKLWYCYCCSDISVQCFQVVIPQSYTEQNMLAKTSCWTEINLNFAKIGAKICGSKPLVHSFSVTTTLWWCAFVKSFSSQHMMCMYMYIYRGVVASQTFQNEEVTRGALQGPVWNVISFGSSRRAGLLTEGAQAPHPLPIHPCTYIMQSVDIPCYSPHLMSSPAWVTSAQVVCGIHSSWF